MEPKVGFLKGLLTFQPNGLFEIPLYTEKSLGISESGLSVQLTGVRREEVLEGGFGAPAIVKARDILMAFILEDDSYVRFSSRPCVTARELPKYC